MYKPTCGGQEVWYGLLILLVPVVLAVVVLQIYGPSGGPLTDNELQHLRTTNVSFASGKITYVAVTTLHYIVCAIVIFRYFVLCRDAAIAKVGGVAPLSFLVPGCLVPTLFLVFFLLTGCFDLAIYEMSSRNVSTIYGIGTTSSVFSWWSFQVASTLPVFTAVLAVTIVGAFTSSQVLRFASATTTQLENYSFTCRRSILECLSATSFLLVTGVLSSAVWFHLPAKIFGDVLGGNLNEMQTSLQKLQNYGDEMTLFWGATYTLVALIAFAWPIWRLSQIEHTMHYTSYSGSGSVAAGSVRNFISLMERALVVLAPLISSLFFNWL